MTFNVQQLGPSFVAEITGFTPELLSDAKVMAALHRHYLENKTVVLRDAALSPEQFVKFSETFGSCDPHHVVAVRHPEQPKITILSNQDETGRKPEMKTFGVGWHSDYSYKRVPSRATLLMAVVVPDQGGDTLFADTVAAYEALSEAAKHKITGLRVRHEYRFMKDRSRPSARWNFLSEAEQAATPEVIHPLVIRHPETGALALFIAPGDLSGVKGIVDMDEAESDVLLSSLFDHMTQAHFTYRHKWRPRDLVIWDNRSTIHSATTDQLPAHQVRRMYRITTNGSVPIAA
ncbi:TauD/TfdA family dioxygenase [Hyphomicrobium sp. CS1BSMeth3]|uniref:TauD/TfdA dioxygenase family protein n=1 Tax=Hyphomicrobium sp. CS1BSMeth3 TaxID=1892844 RepID=UPI0009F93630|nr:TauD/TfdA family dioxygenase [Hyphomicrobium sp. CS1BSMeth3]